MDPVPPASRPNTGRFAFAALIAGSLMLAFGPWMVRLADVGPVASGFWRLAIVSPILLAIGWRSAREDARPGRPLIALIVIGGLFFAADLASWHIGIGLTKLANASLFANCSSFLLVLYGFVIARRVPARLQLLSLASAAVGAALLLGSSYELSPSNFVGDLFALLEEHRRDALREPAGDAGDQRRHQKTLVLSDSPFSMRNFTTSCTRATFSSMTESSSSKRPLKCIGSPKCTWNCTGNGKGVTGTGT